MGVYEICPYCKEVNTILRQEVIGYHKNLLGDKIAVYAKRKRPKCEKCGNCIDMKRSPIEKRFT